MTAHLALKQKRLHEDGVTPAEAARQARLAMGNPALWKETTREAWVFTWLESVWRDISFGARLLAKDRIFTLVAVFTLALSIGANTAIFGLINGLLLRSLPVKDPAQLIVISAKNPPPTDLTWTNGRSVAAKERRQISYLLYEALGRRQTAFSELFAVGGGGNLALQLGDAVHRVRSSQVSGSYFPVLGVEAQRGRLLTREDDVPGGPAFGLPAVVSDDLWTRLFSLTPDAIGARISLERVPFTIVGISPPHFRGIHPGAEVDIWIPLTSLEALYPSFHWRTDPGLWSLRVAGRLQPGITLEQAREQLAALSRPLLEEVKEPNLSGENEKHFLAMKLDAESARTGDSWVAAQFGPALWILMAAVAAVLLIAATNLTNLLLARAGARRQEIATRLAIGASAGRIRRQLLIESSLLALIGTACGLFVAQWLSSALPRVIGSPGGPLSLDIPIDWRLLGFISCIMLAVVLISGWAPAWSASRQPAYESMKRQSGGRTTAGFRSSLIVLQVALSMTLLGGAALLLTSLRTLLREATGFAGRETVFVTPDLFNAGVDRPNMARAYAHLIEETRRQPSVSAAAWTMKVPLSGGLSMFTAEVPGKADLPFKERMLYWHQIGDQYFQAVGVPLRAGRDFPPAESGRKNICILSENAARKFYGSAAAAVGQQIKPGNLPWTEIIGVVADSKYQHIREPEPLTIYLPYWNESASPGMTLAIRHTGPREPLLTAVQALFKREAGRLPLMQITTLDDNLTASVRTERVLTTLLGGFAIFALLISATGVAGLLSYAVQVRRKEIGIRLALGATPAMIGRRFLNYGLKLSLLGLAVGALLSFWLRHAIEAYLFRVSTADPLVWLAVAVLLLMTALAGTVVPARKAAHIDPMQTLRSD